MTHDVLQLREHPFVVAAQRREHLDGIVRDLRSAGETYRIVERQCRVAALRITLYVLVVTGRWPSRRAERPCRQIDETAHYRSEG